MIKVRISEQDLEIIIHERFNHPVPRVQQRMEVLWLKSQGLSHQQISKRAGVCDNAVTKYLRLYKQGGLDGVRKVNFYRPKSEFENHRDVIEQYFRQNPVASLSEAVAKIEELTGFRRRRTQVSVFLKNSACGFEKWGRCQVVPILMSKKTLKKKSWSQE